MLKPAWSWISQKYVRYIASRIPASHIHLSTPVKSVLTRNEGSSVRAEIMTESGSVHHYDHVIMACHSDEALKALRRGNITSMEEQILSKFRWNQNQVILHYDPRVISYTPFARYSLTDECSYTHARVYNWMPIIICSNNRLGFRPRQRI